MEIAGNVTFEALFALAATFLIGLSLFHFKTSNAKHVRINDKINLLEKDVAALKSSSMTEDKVRRLMHEQLDPMKEALAKIDGNIEKIEKASFAWMQEIKESVYLLKEKTSVMDEKIKIQEAKKDA